jgi:hypothetical protein
MDETQAGASVARAPVPTLDFVVSKWDASQHRALVADSWAKTIRGSSREKRKIQEASFFAHYNRRIDAILDDRRTEVRVATPPGDDFMVYGYLVFRPPQLFHMLFVKAPMRRHGIARALLHGLELTGAVFTEWSRDLEEWIVPKLSKVVGRDRFDRPRYETTIVYNPHFLEET